MWMGVDLDGRTDTAALLKVVGEPLRWRILQLLAREELCVCHLVEELDVAQPLISHHLRVLRDAGLVESSRLRYWTYYRLVPEAFLELGRAVTDLAEVAPSRGERRRPCC
jgi:ArsR family transcriptional regulator